MCLPSTWRRLTSQTGVFHQLLTAAATFGAVHVAAKLGTGQKPKPCQTGDKAYPSQPQFAIQEAKATTLLTPNEPRDEPRVG